MNSPVPPTPAPAASDKTSEKHGTGIPKVWIVILSVLAAIIVAAVILVALGRSGHLDHLIYSEEELELLEQQGY